MSVLVNKQTRVICQGFTGSQGTFHSEQAIDYGTPWSAASPRQGRADASRPAGVQFVAEAMKETEANASVIYVPPPFAADSILEAIDAGMPLIICITEGIPYSTWCG